MIGITLPNIHIPLLLFFLLLLLLFEETLAWKRKRRGEMKRWKHLKSSCSGVPLNQRPKPPEPWCPRSLRGARRAASFPGARWADGHAVGASYTGLPFLCSYSESSRLRVSALSLRSFLRNVPSGLIQGLVWLLGSRTLRWMKDGPRVRL